MNIELRNIKHYRGLSRETEAYTADLWAGGVKVGTIENDGNGGMSHIRIADAGTPRGDRNHALIAGATSHVRSLPPREFDGHALPYSFLEDYCDELAFKSLQGKAKARALADMHKRCMFVVGKSIKQTKVGDVGPATEAAILRQFPTAEFLHQMPQDRALALLGAA